MTVWRDVDSMARATGVDEQDRFLGHRLRLPLDSRPCGPLRDRRADLCGVAARDDGVPAHRHGARATERGGSAHRDDARPAPAARRPGARRVAPGPAGRRRRVRGGHRRGVAGRGHAPRGHGWRAGAAPVRAGAGALVRPAPDRNVRRDRDRAEAARGRAARRSSSWTTSCGSWMSPRPRRRRSAGSRTTWSGEPCTNSRRRTRRCLPGNTGALRQQGAVTGEATWHVPESGQVFLRYAGPQGRADPRDGTRCSSTAGTSPPRRTRTSMPRSTRRSRRAAAPERARRAPPSTALAAPRQRSPSRRRGFDACERRISGSAGPVDSG